MSCKVDILNNGTLNNPAVNGGKFNDSTINAPSIAGGITLDKVTSDELVTAIESDLKKVIKELVESETFKQLTADKGIFNQGLDVTGSIILDKVAVQSLAEQLLEATTKVATDEFAKAIKEAQAYIMSKGTINGATTIDGAAATSIHAAVQDKVKQDAETVAKQAIEDKLKEDLSLVLKGTELKNGLSMDDATKEAVFTRLSKDIQALIDKSFKGDDSDVALMIANAIKAKFETDLGAIKATGAEFTRPKLVNPTIEGALSLDDAARKTIADVVTTTVVGTLDTLVQEKFDTTISCWVNENFGGKLAFAFSVVREVEVASESGKKVKDATPTKQVMDLVFFDITKDKPTKEQHSGGSLPEYVTVITIDLSQTVDTYTKDEIDDAIGGVTDKVQKLMQGGYLFAGLYNPQTTPPPEDWLTYLKDEKLKLIFYPAGMEPPPVISDPPAYAEVVEIINGKTGKEINEEINKIIDGRVRNTLSCVERIKCIHAFTGERGIFSGLQHTIMSFAVLSPLRDWAKSGKITVYADGDFTVNTGASLYPLYMDKLLNDSGAPDYDRVRTAAFIPAGSQYSIRVFSGDLFGDSGREYKGRVHYTLTSPAPPIHFGVMPCTAEVELRVSLKVVIHDPLIEDQVRVLLYDSPTATSQVPLSPPMFETGPSRAVFASPVNESTTKGIAAWKVLYQGPKNFMETTGGVANISDVIQETYNKAISSIPRLRYGDNSTEVMCNFGYDTTSAPSDKLLAACAEAAKAVISMPGGYNAPKDE